MTKLMHNVLVFVAMVIALLFGVRLPAQVSTAADTADYKCAWANLDTLRYAQGVGQKRRLSDNGKACATRWFTRNDSVVNNPPPPLPAPPVANFVATCDTTGTLKCHFDGSASTGRKITYQWNCGQTPNCTSTASVFDFTYALPGSKTAGLVVTDSARRTSSSSKTFTVVAQKADSVIIAEDTTLVDSLLKINAPALPQSVPDATPKPCTTHKDVLANADLQAALNAAQPGDCLDLAPGGKWVGNFILPKRTCAAGSAWTTLTTKGVADAPGQRVTPATAANFAQVVTNNNQPAIATGHPTCQWQITHLNINVDPSFTGVQYHLFQLGDGGWVGGGEFNTSVAVQPKNFIVRRNWIHGQTGSNLIRCIALNAWHAAIVDNWISECHAKGFDSQAIEGWNGVGDYLIENNFVSGGAENIMFGGADPAIQGLRPADITIRRNHVWKDPLWKGVWSIKNLFELKNAKRVLADGNVFENNWADAQSGMAIVIKSSQADAPTPTWQGSTDVTFTNNIVRNSHRGFNLQGYDNSGQVVTDDSNHVRRVVARNNLFHNIGASNGVTPTDGWLLLLTHDLKDVAIDNNTFVGNAPDYGLNLYLAYAGGAAPKQQRIRIRNNALLGQSYYAIQSDLGVGCCEKALNAAINDWTFSGNVVSEVDPEFQNPTGNTYLTSITQAGLTSTFTLPNYPGKGANIAQVTAKTAGVVVTSPTTAKSRKLTAVRPPKAPTKADSIFLAHQPQSRGYDVVPTPTAPERRPPKPRR